MKNKRLFPYERNRYFHGKLLNAEDFEAEQKYGNDKRRMISRLLGGTGVAAGLGIVQVDDYSIALEEGIAFDAYGREIIVPHGVTKQIDQLEGFPVYTGEARQMDYMYLCIRYEEEACQEMADLTGRSAYASDGKEYGRYREGYELYLTDREPDHDLDTPEHIVTGTCEIFGGRGISVSHLAPAYMRSDGEMELVVEVRNMGRQHFAFSYYIELKGFTYEGESYIRVAFDERLEGHKECYKLRYVVQTTAADGVEGSLKVKKGSFRMVRDGIEQHAEAAGELQVMISRNNLPELMTQRYAGGRMAQLEGRHGSQELYLARLYFIQTGTSYVMERAEQLPFSQYVYTNNLLYGRVRLLEQEMAYLHRVIEELKQEGRR